MSAVIDEVIDDFTTVRAVLNYTHNTGVRPVNYTFEPPLGVPRNSGEIDARTVTIIDARRANGLKLDVSGFELLHHRSSLTDWKSFRDSELVKAVDYPEVTAALLKHTGADKGVRFDHTLRDSTGAPGHGELREALRRVHGDQTLASAPRRGA